MTPEEIRVAMERNPEKFTTRQFDPAKPVEMPVIQLKSPSAAGAEILANIR